MFKLQTVRGTHDILPHESRRHRLVTETAFEFARRYGYEEISTPIFEMTEVFIRTLGETSDIVTKEMYTFDDRSGDSITLRPEFTAGVARAFISGGLAHCLPLKVFCRGPMFRYERPQKGRLRQFHQIDVEILGVAEPLADIEIIAIGSDILDALGLSEKVTLEINTLGDGKSRANYRAKLVEYFNDYRDKLSDDSLVRLKSNPLRILDSKDKGDRAVVAEAPLLSDSLNMRSQEFFGAVTAGLDALSIDYTLSPRLVRGLDYYCHVAFEFSTETLGSQGAVIAGGRYDSLIETMGGPPTPGTGWAAGVERLAMMVNDVPVPVRPVCVVPIGDAAGDEALRVTHRLRRCGFTVELGYSGNVKKRLNRANKINASAAIFLGEDELAKGVATIRDMGSGEQTEAPLASLEEHLTRYR